MRALPPLTELLAGGADAADITRRLLRGLGSAPSGDGGGGDGGESTTLTPTYGPCEESDLKRRMARAVATLGKVEALRLLAEGGGRIHLTCELCKIDSWCSEADVLSFLE